MQNTSDYEELINELTDEAVEKAVAAVESAISRSDARPPPDAAEDDEEHEDNLEQLLQEELQKVPNCPITLDDALGIAGQAIIDTGSRAVESSSWQGYDGVTEGVTNHAQYHLGRKGECGPNCPGLRNHEVVMQRMTASDRPA